VGTAARVADWAAAAAAEAAADWMAAAEAATDWWAASAAMVGAEGRPAGLAAAVVPRWAVAETGAQAGWVAAGPLRWAALLQW